MKKPRRWSEIRSLIAWWVVVTVVLWVLGIVFDQPVRLAGCAATAALVIAIGEVGDRLRRRWSSGRGARARGTG
ncbi:hypothetical protein OG349_02725 [Streptomyces sp. NBC_01317]|uniref:hypothetical protein n=1 Tax=Streptomyces sp. NBC_01317 TaxID=2903822 RepID=UPI002E0D2C28|nr:hypothetical protein OG349_02725 [Streptomyces sp. NBC_01317]